MKAMGPDGWYWPVVAGPRDDDAPAPQSMTSSD